MSKRAILSAALLLALVWLAAQPGGVDKPEPRFVERPGFLVMGVEAENAMEGDTMVNLWESFFQLQDKIPEPVGKNLYGICVYCTERAESGDCYHYFVGMEIKENVDLPEGLIVHEVPAATYAVFDHVGPVENINQTYDYIFDDWMPSHDRKMALQDLFEQYDERFSAISDKSLVEIWVPIVGVNPPDIPHNPDGEVPITP